MCLMTGSGGRTQDDRSARPISSQMRQKGEDSVKLSENIIFFLTAQLGVWAPPGDSKLICDAAASASWRQGRTSTLMATADN